MTGADAALAARVLPEVVSPSSGFVSPMAARDLALSEEPLFMVERDGLLVVASGAFDGAIQLVPPGRQAAVFLHPDGQLSFDPRTPPESQLEETLALHVAATHDDRIDQNLFAGFPQERLAATLDSLEATLAAVDPNDLQTRTSTATLLLELAEATESSNDRARIALIYDALVRSEPVGEVRQALALQLSVSGAAIAPEIAPIAAELRPEFSPISPPYEAWMREDGTMYVDIRWTAGGPEFEPGAIDQLKAHGFTLVEENGGASILEKRAEIDGLVTTMRVEVRVGAGGMFAGMADPSTSIIFYDGHADFGRNVTRALENAPDAPDGGRGKVIFVGMCIGKYNLDEIQAKYPNAQIVTTFGQSFFRGSPMDESENLDALFAMLGGVEKRAGWAELHQAMEDASHAWDPAASRFENMPWNWHRPYDNYVTPFATYSRERAMDRDDDGQADLVDEVFDAAPIVVAPDPARQFEPIHHEGAVFAGPALQRSAQAANRFAGYNEIIRDFFKDSRVFADGYFIPEPGETDIVRFTAVGGPDGVEQYRVQLNADYAHMPEDALRAVIGFELNRFLVESGRIELDPVDASLNGLMIAMGTMNKDLSSRDRAIWEGLLETYGLPAIDFGQVHGPVNATHDLYAGNRETLRTIRESLSPEILAQLA